MRRALVLSGGVPASSLDLKFLTGALDSRITFTRSGAGGTYFNSAGTLTAAGADVPRFDYDPITLLPRGLLIEEARTNSLLNSATLSTQSVTVTAVPWTLSFYGTGTVTKSGAATGALVGTGATTRVSQTFTPSAGSLTCTVSGSVTNAQLEAGAFATSYIPTTGATVTRADDIATMALTGWYSASVGSLYTETVHAGVRSSSFPRIVQIDDGTNNTLVSHLLSTASGRVYSTGSQGGVSQWQIGPNSAFAVGVTNKVASSWSAGAQAYALNGGNATFASGATVPGPLNIMRLGRDTGNILQGMWLRRIRFWPKVLSIGQLRQVTR